MPPGTIPGEKSDDIKAKLSSGEYVLPAEVVRFYGLDKIEKMVNSAKEGLGAMQESGRIKQPPQAPQGQPGQQQPQQPPQQMQQPAQRPPQQPQAVPGGQMQQRQPIPALANGGMVRKTLPDGRTIFVPPGVAYTPGHQIMGGNASQKSAMQQVAEEQQKKAEDAAKNSPFGEGATPGGESDASTNDTKGAQFDSFDDMVNNKDFQDQFSALMGFMSPKATLGTVAKGIADAVSNANDVADTAGARDDPGTPGAAGSGGDTGTGKDAVGGDGVGSGVEGGMGTTGGHDDGGEDSGSDSTDGSESAAAGGGDASEAGNDADGDGNSDTGLKDGGFIAGGKKLPKAVTYKRKK